MNLHHIYRTFIGSLSLQFPILSENNINEEVEEECEYTMTRNIKMNKLKPILQLNLMSMLLLSPSHEVRMNMANNISNLENCAQ